MLRSVSRPLLVNTDFCQYYASAAGGDFDESSVDAAHDGVIAPGSDGVRIATGTHGGQVELTVTVTDEPILFPAGDDVVAPAGNLNVADGVIAVHHFAGSAVFVHDFGRALRCGFLIQVHDRDAARSANYRDGHPARERHDITISSCELRVTRWRTRAIDGVGASLQACIDHVGGKVDTADEVLDGRVVLPGDGAFADGASEGPSAHPRYSDADIERLIWGGALPSPRLEAIGGPAAGIAGIDREFADDLLAADERINGRSRFTVWNSRAARCDTSPRGPPPSPHCDADSRSRTWRPISTATPCRTTSRVSRSKPTRYSLQRLARTPLTQHSAQYGT